MCRLCISFVCFILLAGVVLRFVEKEEIPEEKRRREAGWLYNKYDEKDVNNFGRNVNLIIEKNRQRNKSDLKYILHWSDHWNLGGNFTTFSSVQFGWKLNYFVESKEYDIGFGREPFYANACPETRCYITDDRELVPVEDFAAIVFFHRSLAPGDVPQLRSPNQRYVYYMDESPNHSHLNKLPLSAMGGFYNWTMTYTTQSDLFKPYGWIVKVQEHPTGEALEEYIKNFGQKNSHLAQGKTGTAAWLVSNHNSASGREAYVKDLEQYIDVDVIGQFSVLQCNKDPELCAIEIEAKYKFYMALENSICDDYVTEKFFRTMRYNIIPVTANGANMSSLAPPHSYIDALAFKGPKELSDHMKKVGSDPALYASYFWWKDFYQVRTSREDISQVHCDLCSMLHNNPSKKVYDDLDTWWNLENGNCRTMNGTSIPHQVSTSNAPSQLYTYFVYHFLMCFYLLL